MLGRLKIVIFSICMDGRDLEREGGGGNGSLEIGRWRLVCSRMATKWFKIVTVSETLRGQYIIT